MFMLKMTMALAFAAVFTVLGVAILLGVCLVRDLVEANVSRAERKGKP